MRAENVYPRKWEDPRAGSAGGISRGIRAWSGGGGGVVREEERDGAHALAVDGDGDARLELDLDVAGLRGGVP